MKYFLIILSLFSNHLRAQLTGKVDNPSMGISFTVPQGWMAQEGGGGYVLTSNTTEGFMLVTTNNNSDMNTMKVEARKGISDSNGNYLYLTSAIEELETYIIGAEYEGVINGEAAKAYIIGAANTEGPGVSLTAASPINSYSDTYRQLCFELANTLTIYSRDEIKNAVTNKTSPKRSTMESEFGGARLSYFDSYSSGGYGSYGGYSNKVIIDLCEQGYFSHSAQSSMAVDTGGGFGSSGGGGNGAGTWRIIEKPGMKPILHLGFYDGTVYEYYITFEGKKTFLDGKRYFRVYGEDGARCH